MSKFRKLQAKLQKIDEGYFKELDIELQELVKRNTNLTNVQLVALARSLYGQEAATYLSDQLETEGDTADYFAEEEGGRDDFWAETERQDAKIAEFAINEFSDLGFKRHSNWPAGTNLVASGDLRKQVRTKFKQEGWTKAEPGSRQPSWYAHPTLPYHSVVEYDRGRTVVTSMLPYGSKIEEDMLDLDDNPFGNKYGWADAALELKDIKADYDNDPQNDEIRAIGARMRKLSGIEEDHHPEDPINRQIKSLLAHGKKVMSKVPGAFGEVISINDKGISMVQGGVGTGTDGVNFEEHSNIEIVDQAFNYDIVQHWDDDGIDEGNTTSHLSDKIAVGNSVMIMGYNLMSNRRLPVEVKIVDFVKHPGARPTVHYKGKDGKVKSMAVNVFKSKMRAAQEPVSEAVIEVPAELRGTTRMTGKATSDDASEFMGDLGIDDEVSHDVVNPETGELLFQPGQTKREEMKKGAHVILNRDDFTRDVKLRQPIMHAGFGKDFERQQNDAYELLSELRNSDFYNVVWRDVADMVDDPDMMRENDYDIDVDVPVVLKRKDGLRLDDDDHDNIEEIIRAVKNASTMQNVGISYMGSTNRGTTVRFTPMFH